MVNVNTLTFIGDSGNGSYTLNGGTLKFGAGDVITGTLTGGSNALVVDGTRSRHSINGVRVPPSRLRVARARAIDDVADEDSVPPPSCKCLGSRHRVRGRVRHRLPVPPV